MVREVPKDVRKRKMKTKPDKKILYEIYTEQWNKRIPQMCSDFELDIKDFPDDKNIDFKWVHLLHQEVWMWVDLCCGNIAEYSQVPLDEFNFIVERRGFTPRITKTLSDVLIAIGIGEELKAKENNMSLTIHAKKELEIAGLFDKDSDYNGSKVEEGIQVANRELS